jgi:hypothetical protein
MDLSAKTNAELSASLTPSILGIQAQLSRAADASVSLKEVLGDESVSALPAASSITQSVQAIDQFRSTAYTATAKLERVLALDVDLSGSATLNVGGLLNTMHTSVIGLQAGVAGAASGIASLPQSISSGLSGLSGLQSALTTLQSDLGRSADSLQSLVTSLAAASGSGASADTPGSTNSANAAQSSAAAFTANNLPILSGTISLPRVGAWQCVLELGTEDDTQAPVEGSAITIKDGVRSFVGTITRSGIVSGRVSLRAAGGAGGLRNPVPANSWTNVPLRIPLRDTLAAVGETLNTTVVSSLLETRLDHWTRAAGPAGSALSAMLEPQGASWRVLADGTVWAGVETWTDQKVAGGEVLEPDPELGTFTIASDSLELEPGRTFLGRKVSRVEHRIESGSVRTFYWVEDAGRTPGKLDRVKEDLSKFVRWVMRDVTYHKLYPSVVQTQHADGTIDLYPDDEAIRGRGCTSVKIRHGLPGCKVTVPAGAKVLLGFESGDPARPYAALWEPDSITSIVFDNGTQSLARVGDLVVSGGAMTQVTIYTIVPTPIITPAGPGTIPPGVPIVGFISFSLINDPAGATAEPLYGAIATGATKLLG